MKTEIISSSLSSLMVKRIEVDVGRWQTYTPLPLCYVHQAGGSSTRGRNRPDEGRQDD